MAFMLDYSGFRPSTSQLQLMKASGVIGVLRYLSAPISATAWKRITPAEVAQIRGAGLDLILNWEWYEGRCLEGAPAGTQDGRWALAAAQAVGYPRGATIYASHDTGTRNDAAVIAYLRAFNLALGGYYRTDVYSGFGTVEAVLNATAARYGWQTLAWSNGQLGRARLYQNGKQWFGGQADENVVRARPLGTWNETLAAGKPIVAPAPKPAPAPAPKPAPAPAKPVQSPTHAHTVVYGDTLYKLALASHTTVANLVALNRGKYPSLVRQPDFLSIGWVLQLPGATKPPAPAPARVYAVQSGDSLSSIAAHFHTSVGQLVAWNKASYRSLATDPNLIRVGWTLRVAA